MQKVLLVFLVWGSISDIKSKSISGFYLIVLFIGTFTGMVIEGKLSLSLIAGGWVVGGSCIFLSYASAGEMGMGDGLVIGVIGMYLGFMKTILWCGISFFISSFLALFLWLIYKDRTRSFPFIPCLLSGALYMILSGMF